MTNLETIDYVILARKAYEADWDAKLVATSGDLEEAVQKALNAYDAIKEAGNPEGFVSVNVLTENGAGVGTNLVFTPFAPLA